LRLRCAEEVLQKRKRLLSPPPRCSIRCGNFRSPTIWRVFHYTQQTSTTTGLTTGPIPGVEQQIISTIKTIRKKN
jgi:hypothetical protein